MQRNAAILLPRVQRGVEHVRNLGDISEANRTEIAASLHLAFSSRGGKELESLGSMLFKAVLFFNAKELEKTTIAKHEGVGEWALLPPLASFCAKVQFSPHFLTFSDRGKIPKNKGL